MHRNSDDHLVRYLLGDLPDEEAERLDERSLTDDAFALRLRVMENDLVDRYARGEPLDVSLERFDRLYRASPNLRDKVQFAQAFQALTTKSAPGRTPLRIGPAPNRYWWRSLAAAAVLLMAAAGYLGLRTMRLSDELGRLETQRAAVEQRNAHLQQELERARAAATPPLSPLAATFLLPPPRRGLGSEPTTIALPEAAEQVTLRLQVESGDYATSWAALRDLATIRIVWRSGDLPAEVSASDSIVTFTVPANVLVGERYSVELFGITSSGSPELLGHYPIRVVLQ